MESNETLDYISKALGEPFPQNAIKTHPQTKMKYVEGHTYIHRLNDATGNTWDWKIARQDFHPYGATGKGNARLLITVIGELTIPGLGTRAGMGVQVVTADTGGEDMWKGAMTDAIKAAAKLFGVGLELYGPDYEAGDLPALPNRDRSTSRNTVSEIAGATQTNGTEKPVRDDVEMITAGQGNVIKKHQGDLGWSEEDMALIIAAHNYTTSKEFTAEQARQLITIMADPSQADPYIASLRNPKQAQMIDTTDASARARN